MGIAIGRSATQAVGSVVLPRAGRAASLSRFASSLSAIHQGLRRSDKADARRGSSRMDAASTDPRRPRYRERQEILAARGSPDLKIRKGKKDITEDPFPKSPSRRARFNSPEYSFGKESLVYQAKNGKYRDLVQTMKRQEDAKRPPILSHSRKTPTRVPNDRQALPRRNADWEGKPPRRLVRQTRDTPDERTSSDRPFWKTKPSGVISRTTAASQFLYGASVVEAALRSPRRKFYRLYWHHVQDRENGDRSSIISELARKSGVKVELIDRAELPLLDKLSDGRPHNGYVLEASTLPQLPLVSLGPVSDDADKSGYQVAVRHQSAEDAQINGTSDFVATKPGTHKPLVIVLDRIEDPGNLGAILRTAAFMGVHAVAMTTRNSATLTPVALKASAGGAEELTLFSVQELGTFLSESRAHGWQVYAAMPPSTRAQTVTQRRLTDVDELAEADPLAQHSCILVIGNEGEGVSPSSRRQADYEVSIPNAAMSVNVDSLNVSVAAGLLCSAFLRGRTKELSRTKDEARMSSQLFELRMK